MIKDLETALGYRFQNITLLHNALTHSSYANERWHNSLLSNERLGFLGDSVLGMLVADYLYRTFPDRPEGELTRMRADMVCETTLAAAANRIGLGEHLLLGHGEERFGGRTRNSILADAMESVIAASFLDGGLEAALKIVQQFILVEVPVTKLHNADYKTALQELVQQKKNQVLSTTNSLRWKYPSTALWWARVPAAARNARSRMLPAARLINCFLATCKKRKIHTERTRLLWI